MHVLFFPPYFFLTDYSRKRSMYLRPPRPNFYCGHIPENSRDTFESDRLRRLVPQPLSRSPRLAPFLSSESFRITIRDAVFFRANRCHEKPSTSFLSAVVVSDCQWILISVYSCLLKELRRRWENLAHPHRSLQP